MKKLFAAIVFFIVSSGFFLPPQCGYAQRASAYNNVVSVDFVNFLINNLAFAQYETKLTSTSSLAIRAAYVNVSQSGSEPTVAYGAGAAYRFYLLDSRALAGFSVGPAIDVMFFKNSGTDRHGIVFALGADAAYKWFFGQFILEPTFGLRWGNAPGTVLPAGESNFSGIYYNVSVFLGYSW